MAFPVKSPYRRAKIDLPASSKWPFDHPNGGHLTPEKGHLNSPKDSPGRTWWPNLRIFHFNQDFLSEIKDFPNTKTTFQGGQIGGYDFLQA